MGDHYCGRRWWVYYDRADRLWRSECRTHWEHDSAAITWREAFDYADRMARAER